MERPDKAQKKIKIIKSSDKDEDTQNMSKKGY